MKIKLAALLALIVFGLAGCSAADEKANTNTAPAATTSPATTAPAAAQNNANTVPASAEATSSTGGTKEGCKCSAAGMACNTKEGGKGCCGGKDGSCSTMKAGASSCCATADKCCSVAKMTGMPEGNTNKSSEPAPPPKKS